MSPRSVPLVASSDAATQAARRPRQAPPLRRLIKFVLSLYLRPYHRLELQGQENLPPHGPLLVVLNHASLLDVPALMVLDPFPDTATVVKSSMFKLPVVGWILRRWGAIPVDREGRDTSSIRSMLGVLRRGQVLAVAAEGTRTRSGHLEAINPVLARIAASADVPVVAVGIGGSYAALPPGALLPRPTKILVRAGHPFRLERGTDAAAAAERIRREIAALLPPDMQPLDWGAAQQPMATAE
jgi:1-acyl-sn-glycerol-3-phosphate acyltransferase